MMQGREWEKFRGGPAAPAGGMIRVTLNRKGLIYMNAKAYQMMGKPKAVAIYYNRKEDMMALEPGSPRQAENFHVTKKQNGWSIHAASFCRHFGIRVHSTERFLRPGITESGQMILNLRETVSVGGIEKNGSVRRTEERQICDTHTFGR